MATLEKINQIAELNWAEDDENAAGFVAEIAPEKETELEKQFQASGYETSTSSNEEGRHFLWVMGGAESQELVIVPMGGVGFHVRLVGEHETRGNFLGSIEFGSLDADGQYEQDDDEIIDAAREQFKIDESIPAVVR